jgi:hypothetical protein
MSTRNVSEVGPWEDEHARQAQSEAVPLVHRSEWVGAGNLVEALHHNVHLRQSNLHPCHQHPAGQDIAPSSRGLVIGTMMSKSWVRGLQQ